MKQSNGAMAMPSAALISVCMECDTLRGMSVALGAMPKVLHTADFETYVSPARRPHLSQQVRSAELCVAVVNFDVDVQQALESVTYLHQALGGRCVLVAVSSNADTALMLSAMRAGCAEFLLPEELGPQLTELFNRLDQRRLQAEALPVAAGQVLSFFGAKGGVGATTLAVHLATYLVQEHGQRVLLIDNQPELGHVCVYLGIDGARYHFHELVRNVNRLDSELLRGFTAKHTSGLEVLSSPDAHGGTRHIDAESLRKLLEFLRSEYDFVIIDGAKSLEETSLAVIEGSDHIYLVATPEISAIRDLSRYVDSLMQTEETMAKMQVVINHFSSRYAVELEHIEKAIRLPVAIKLPNSYLELVRSVNLGEPVAPNRRSEFSAVFLDWAERLAGTSGVAHDAAPRHKLLAHLFGRSFHALGKAA